MFFFFDVWVQTSTALTYTFAAFGGAAAFNADISKWGTDEVTSMESSTFNFSLFVSFVQLFLFHGNGSLTIFVIFFV